MLRLLGALLVVFLIVLGVGYYLNWFNFAVQRDAAGNRVGVSVEVNKDRIKHDSDRFDQGVSNFGKKVGEGVREAVAKTRGQSHTVKGDLMKVEEGASRLTLQTSDNQTLAVQVEGATRIRRNNVNVNMGELMEGDHLVVAYREQDGRKVAETITVEPGA